MRPDRHRARAEEIERSIDLLVAEDVAAHVATIIEAAYGTAQQYLAYGMQQQVGSHVDGHVGLIRALNGAGLTSVAALFDRLERLRTGHWYGAQGNGAAAREALDVLAEVKRWSLS